MLIQVINDIKEYLPVNKSLEIDNLKPFIADAERIIKETIGAGFYAELDIYNANPLPQNLYFDEVIAKLKDSIAHLTFHLGFDVHNTIISNHGFHRIETEESKKALFQRQEENLKDGFKTQGYNKLDLALEFLELHKTEFASWATSEEYTLAKRHFINSTREFSNIYNINNSRLVFMKLRNAQTLVEDFDIIPLIGFELYNELKAQITADNLSMENSQLVKYIQKAVAYRSIYRGGVQLITELNEYGFMQKEFDITDRNIKKQTAAKENLLNQILQQAEQTGIAYLSTVETFLKQNLSSFPLFENSSAYDDTGSVFNIDINSKIVTI